MTIHHKKAVGDSPRYADWAHDLSLTPLFCGLSAEEVASLLEALSPPVREGRPECGEEGGSFRLVVECDPVQSVRLGRHAYSMPAAFTPGMLLAEVSSLSGLGDYAAALPPEMRRSLPELPWRIVTLELDVRSLTADLGTEVAWLQVVVLGNLARMMAQKVVDARRELLLERTGIDIYGE